MSDRHFHYYILNISSASSHPAIDGALIMVECVDQGLIQFTSLKNLYEIPKVLLGVPACGVWIVLADSEVICWPMSHPSEVS
jgi:hypothetical protein